MKEEIRAFLEEIELRPHPTDAYYVGYLGGYYLVSLLELEKTESVKDLKQLICEKIDVQATAIKNLINTSRGVYKNFPTLDKEAI